MRVRFWGTRGSIAKAGPSTVRYGGNTSCVEVRSEAGTLLLLDCGTGAHGLGFSLLDEPDGPRRGHILVTHTHWDHIQGFPFFRPLFRRRDEWTVYGPRGLGPTLRETLSGQMQYTYFPVSIDQLKASVAYHDLVEGTFDVGDIKVTAQYLNHPSLTLGYRLECDDAVVVYATDHEPHARELARGGRAPAGGEDERHVQFIAGADLLIHDAQYTAEEYPAKVGWGHSTIEYAVDSALAGGVHELALFHHDPLRDDVSVDGLLARARARVSEAGGTLKVIAAAEGADLALRPHHPGPSRAAAERSTLPARGMQPDLAAQRVLVAVDDEATRALLMEAAAADCLPPLQTGDPNGLAALVARERPALVLLGRTLGGADALDLCRDLRSGGDGDNAAPALVVVAEQSEVEREAGTAAGVDDWLVLPCTPQYLRTRIRAWILRTAFHWQPALVPPDEERRLASLYRLGLLDTAPEERFDRYTRIAAALFNVPIVLVSLIDRERQWFKSRCGVEVEETPRDMAFCAHTINTNDQLMLVEDALEDQRFADNPLVTRAPRVRFYAGTPLTLEDGSRAGAFCLMDHRPRSLDTRQLQLLRDLGELVARELEA